MLLAVKCHYRLSLVTSVVQSQLLTSCPPCLIDIPLFGWRGVGIKTSCENPLRNHRKHFLSLTFLLRFMEKDFCTGQLAEGFPGSMLFLGTSLSMHPSSPSDSYLLHRCLQQTLRVKLAPGTGRKSKASNAAVSRKRQGLSVM